MNNAQKGDTVISLLVNIYCNNIFVIIDRNNAGHGPLFLFKYSGTQVQNQYMKKMLSKANYPNMSIKQ